MKFSVVRIKRHTRSEKGFTLIELIMAMAIMSILLTMYYSLFFTGGKQYDFVHDSYKMQNEARIAMTYITTKIRQNDELISGTDRHAVRHAVSIQTEGVAPNERKYLQIETLGAGGDSEYEYIYKYYYAGSGETKLMTSQTAAFQADGHVIADSLNDIELEEIEENGNTCIKIVVKYDTSGKGKFEETVVLRAK